MTEDQGRPDAPTGPGAPIDAYSVVVLSHNEEQVLGRCLRSLRLVRDVHVLDSGSTDGTEAVARHAGARFTTRVPPGGFVITEQRNWGLANLPLAEWVLFLDSDEVATEDFLRAVERAVVVAAPGQDGFWTCPKFMYQGTWLRRYMGFPNWHPRVMRRGVRLTGDVWESFPDQCQAGFIRVPYIHYANARGLEDWVGRHLRYALHEGSVSATRRGVPGEKRATRRRLARMAGPARPFLVLGYHLVVRRGALDGGAVWSYARRHMLYELMISEASRQAGRDLRGAPR